MSRLNLPDTGVNNCYDNLGKDIPTPGKGEQYYGQDGCFELHPMQFKKLDANAEDIADAASWEDGYRMVCDENTGLTWEIKSPDPDDINYCKDQYSFKDAQTVYIKRLNDSEYGGHSDWRMPNKDELRSIFDYSIINPAVDTWYFPHTQIDFYWTKDVYQMQPYFGWVLFFGLGSGTASGQTANQYVRAVRGGNNAQFGKPDKSRFQDNGDGTITDNVTRLMWQKDENDRMSWFDALESCEKMDLAGHKDWRLPNIKELNTILNLNYDDGWWYFKDAFPADGLQPPLLHYFSSTPYEKYYVWVTNFCFGYDGYYASKKATLLFRAVRNLDAPLKSSNAFVLSDSGQRDCYDDEGNVINEPAKGDDFYGQDGNFQIHPLSCNKMRDGGHPIADNVTEEEGFSMVFDNNTGLIWETKSNDPVALNSIHKRYTYGQALDYIEILNENMYGGFSDWRMPNREELRSIVSYGKYSPSLADTFDDMCACEFYWSCDPYGANPDLVWGIYFAIGCGICYPKENRYAVRAVRGGYNLAFGTPDARSYTDNSDGTVIDNNTGLMWMQGEPPDLNWNEAMKYCTELDLAGQTDWRMPSIKEIATLIDVSFSENSWHDKNVFPEVKTKPLGFYWAASTYASSFAWGVNFQFGYDGYYAGKKTGKYPFRPVRSTR